MQKGVNENEFFYFTGDFGLIKEKVTEITDRIIRRTAGTTLADFFAVSVCPVSFGLLPFQYWFAGFGPLSRYSSPRNSTTRILYGIPGVIFLLLFSAGWKFPFRSSGIRIRPVLLHVSDNSGSVPAKDGCVNGSDNRFLWSDIKSFSDVTHFGLTVAFPLSGQKPPERCPGPFHRPVHTERQNNTANYTRK